MKRKICLTTKILFWINLMQLIPLILFLSIGLLTIMSGHLASGTIFLIITLVAGFSLIKSYPVLYSIDGEKILVKYFFLFHFYIEIDDIDRIYLKRNTFIIYLSDKREIKLHDVIYSDFLIKINYESRKSKLINKMPALEPLFSSVSPRHVL